MIVARVHQCVDTLLLGNPVANCISSKKVITSTAVDIPWSSSTREIRYVHFLENLTILNIDLEWSTTTTLFLTLESWVSFGLHSPHLQYRFFQYTLSNFEIRQKLQSCVIETAATFELMNSAWVPTARCRYVIVMKSNDKIYVATSCLKHCT